MLTKVGKWGNSLAIRIPRSFARQVRVEDGSTVDLSVQDGELIVKPTRRMYRLAELLDDVTSDNIHGEVDTGEPLGHEAW